MNYRHAFHAGNFADVVKHAVLARILVHLREKPQPFRVIDTHAGAGLYDLAGPEASRSGEWRAGIGRLNAAALAPAAGALVAPYPPFEDRDEFSRLAKSLEDAHRKWPTGIFLAWYPRKDPNSARALATRLKRSGIPKLLRVELDLGDDLTRLVGAGLLIVNPPWRLDEDLAILLPELARVLAQHQRPQVRIDRLAA
jgi:23S rRNA (adenine2030-N6)-methyltransferase